MASYHHILGLWHIRGHRLHIGFGNRRFKIGLLQCPFGWNVRRQHRQTTVHLEYSGSSCHDTCRRDHISPVLADIHWLPIRARITYKIATFVFKIGEVKQPMYLAELIENYKPGRELRSTSRSLLKEPCLKITTGQRSFHIAAVNIWNGLPDHIRSVDSFETFRKHLKLICTHCHIAASCNFFAPTNSLWRCKNPIYFLTYLLTYLLTLQLLPSINVITLYILHHK